MYHAAIVPHERVPLPPRMCIHVVRSRRVLYHRCCIAAPSWSQPTRKLANSVLPPAGGGSRADTTIRLGDTSYLRANTGWLFGNACADDLAP